MDYKSRQSGTEAVTNIYCVILKVWIEGIVGQKVHVCPVVHCLAICQRLQHRQFYDSMLNQPQKWSPLGLWDLTWLNGALIYGSIREFLGYSLKTDVFALIEITPLCSSTRQGLMAWISKWSPWRWRWWRLDSSGLLNSMERWKTMIQASTYTLTDKDWVKLHFTVVRPLLKFPETFALEDVYTKIMPDKIKYIWRYVFWP